MSTRRPAAALLAAAVLALTAACGAGASGDPGAADSATDSGADQTLTVFAAASLAEPMDDLLDMFAEDHPEESIQPAVYDGSATLGTQPSDAAQAAGLAAANTATRAELGAA